MDVNALFQRRVSLRRYAQREIAEADLDFILQSALRAPTAGNMMLYSVIKVTDPVKKLQLSKSCDNQPFIARAPVLLIFCADFQRWYDYYKYSNVPESCAARGVPFRRPAEGDLVLAMSDALIASSFATIAGESRQIGSCYIGDIIEQVEYHAELLDLPQWVVPVGMLCLGYYPDNHRRQITPRFPQESIVFDERYQRLSTEQLQNMFQPNEAAFKSKNKFAAENFGQFNYYRKTGTAFSEEMTRSVKAIIARWCSN